MLGQPEPDCFTGNAALASPWALRECSKRRFPLLQRLPGGLCTLSTEASSPAWGFARTAAVGTGHGEAALGCFWQPHVTALYGGLPTWTGTRLSVSVVLTSYVHNDLS
ncbi:hypothetical protein [Paenibacillus sp. FJAT-26967]|uniref:hypothetical protein n=1 Tax=Paenibacillus sp. FJAT-26967 TaxID=1729690 RepID=UPI00083985D3|nr:hypothetical protein [Paenibacillus sp. FJAT-26967]